MKDKTFFETYFDHLITMTGAFEGYCVKCGADAGIYKTKLGKKSVEVFGINSLCKR